MPCSASRPGALISALLFPLLVSCGSAGLTIVSDGRGDYAIVAPENVSPAERRAVEELQSFLEDISGAILPVTTERDAPSDH